MSSGKHEILPLIDTDAVTPATRRVLHGRLSAPAVTKPAFFDAETFALLQAVSNRLIPQPEREQPVDLAGALDRNLAAGKGNGWRYDILPPDGEAFTTGLKGVDETARLLHGKPFLQLENDLRDGVLASVQHGTPAGVVWQALSASRFFEELLAALVELYYSHPLAKEEIGDVSFADAPGWRHIGLNGQDEQEPQGLQNQQSG